MVPCRWNAVLKKPIDLSGEQEGYQLYIRQVPNQTKTSPDTAEQQWHVTSALLSGLDEEKKFLRAMSYVIAQGT